MDQAEQHRSDLGPRCAWSSSRHARKARGIRAAKFLTALSTQDSVALLRNEGGE
jgi:hypothetical protein